MAKKQPSATHKPAGVHSVSPKSDSGGQGLGLSNKVLIPAVIFLLIAMALIYCKPVLEGMQLSAHDSNQYVAMNKEIADYKERSGHNSLWSSRMFSGMPSYLMGGYDAPALVTNSPLAYLHRALRNFPEPSMEIILLLLCSFLSFYILTRRIMYALLGAVAIGFCTANFVSLDAGHITKVNTIAMFLPLFTGVWLVFQKKYIPGMLMALLFAYEIIDRSHIQIAYYGSMLIGFYMLFAIVLAVKSKEIRHAVISTLLVASCFIIGGMMNFNNYFVNDFSKDTTRGTEILDASRMDVTADAAAKPAVPVKAEKGVGFDYATRWSLGYEELGTLLVPNFAGGSSAAGLDENSSVYKTLSGKGVPPQQAAQFVQRMPLYWGSEPFVQGPIYLGAIVVFLFIFGFFAYKGNLRWWITAGVLLAVLIALGKNLEPFYRLMYNLVPMFNKFRAPTMILALAQVLMVVLGVLGLKDFFDTKISSKEDRIKSLKLSTGITGGLLLFFIVLGSIFSFQSKASDGGQTSDDQFKAQLTQMTGDEGFANEIYGALKKDRTSLMRSDAVRSLVLVLLAAGLLLLFAAGKFKKESYLVGGLCVLILADFWMINKRYLNDDDFEDKEMIAVNSFPQTPADAAILADNKDGARMADFSGDIFNSASPAYFHRTIGGYNPAKLRRYQDVIEYGLSFDFQLLNTGGFSKANFVNMLNTRYIKQSPEANGVIQNPFALGNAWFVNQIETANSPEEELLNVRKINPAQTAIIHKDFEKYVAGFTPNPDTTGFSSVRYIRKLETNNPMKLEYEFTSDQPEFVVFSEVIYRPNEDWISSVDGKQSDHIRVNYILRGMKVDKGQHKITFEFKPKLLATTNAVILAGNGLFYLLFLGALFLLYRQNKSKSPV
jgi:hypothetical protein